MGRKVTGYLCLEEATPDLYAAVQRLQAISAGLVLDVGTGNGAFIRLLIKTLGLYEGFVGVDISEEALAQARAKPQSGWVEFRRMDAGNLEFTEASFDTVCASDLLHHLAEPGRALAEMRRVLKPDGLLLLQEMCADPDQPPAHLNAIYVHTLVAEIDALQGQVHRPPLTSQAMRDLLEGAGFSRLDILVSAWPGKCAFCPHLADCLDPLRPSNQGKGRHHIREGLKGIRDHPRFAEYQTRAKTLRNLVRQHGYVEAPVAFVFGSK